MRPVVAYLIMETQEGYERCIKYFPYTDTTVDRENRALALGVDHNLLGD